MHNSYKGPQSPDGKPAIEGKQILESYPDLHGFEGF
jgi:hypothetical protein